MAVSLCSDAYTGSASDLQVVLSNVRCDGSETSIFHCPSNGWLQVDSSCSSHARDAGVFCYKHGMTFLGQIANDKKMFIISLQYQISYIHHDYA